MSTDTVETTPTPAEPAPLDSGPADPTGSQLPAEPGQPALLSEVLAAAGMYQQAADEDPGVTSLRNQGIDFQDRASARFREADFREHQARLVLERDVAADRHDHALAEQAQAEQAVTAAIAAGRAAADRARLARDYWQASENADRRAKRENAPPEELVTRMVRTQKAAELAAERSSEAQSAARSIDEAETALTRARDEVTRTEELLAAAEYDVANPGHVTKSPFTLMLDTARMLLTGTCTDEEKAVASMMVKALAHLCGLDEALKAKARQEAEEEFARRPITIQKITGQRSMLPPASV